MAWSQSDISKTRFSFIHGFSVAFKVGMNATTIGDSDDCHRCNIDIKVYTVE